MEHLEVWDFTFIVSSILNFALISWDNFNDCNDITENLYYMKYILCIHTWYVYDTAVVQVVDLVVSSLDSYCCEFRAVVRQRLQETSEDLRLGF